MVDLGDLARLASLFLFSGGCFALSDCILYQVNGKYRSQAQGLSCYYSYDGDRDVYSGYANIGTGKAFKY